MKYSKEDITTIFNRISLSLKTDDEVLKPDDEWILDIPIVDEFIRCYNKQQYNKSLNDRIIHCSLCNVDMPSRNKTNHIRTTKHQAKLNGNDNIFTEKNKLL